MVERLGLRVDAASLKVQSQEEAIKDVKQSKPRLLVQIQVCGKRISNLVLLEGRFVVLHLGA